MPKKKSMGALPMGLLLVLLLMAALPFAALLWIAFGSAVDEWPHLLRYVLPKTAGQTFGLLVLVALGTGIVGAGTAWLTTLCSFPGRKIFAWALVLPLGKSHCCDPILTYKRVCVILNSVTARRQHIERQVTGQQTTNCPSYDTQETCNEFETCHWDGSTCSNKCPDYKTQATCDEFEACHWDGKACSNKEDEEVDEDEEDAEVLYTSL